jgi:hypothetical protein
MVDWHKSHKCKKNHKFIKITDCGYIQVNTTRKYKRVVKDAPTPIKWAVFQTFLHDLYDVENKRRIWRSVNLKTSHQKG